jgi:hypothetical protein
MFKRHDKEGWKGYKGPFDELKEKIIAEFEKKGLSRNMRSFPKTGTISLSFHPSKWDFFTCNINTFHEFYGLIPEGKFSIPLCIDKFTEYPGDEPHFHYHSIPKIEIPNKILYLFRGYPLLDICTGEDIIDSYRIYNHPLTISYEPSRDWIYKNRFKQYQFDPETILYLKKDDRTLRRDTDPMRKKPIPELDLEKFPNELKAGDVFEKFEEFLQKIVAYLSSLPVNTVA